MTNEERIYLREWKRNRTPEQRARHLNQDRMTRRLKVYGINPDQFREMMIEQDGKCAICTEPMPVPCIDHDHTNGMVRGLLCNSCNIGIGRLGDDPENLMRAYLYLMGLN